MIRWIDMAKGSFRAFERRVAHLPASVSVLGEPAEAVRLINLSLGGACLELATPLEPGVPIRLEVESPDLWDPLKLPAKVIWVDREAERYRAGVHFQYDNAKIAGWLMDILTSEAYA